MPLPSKREFFLMALDQAGAVGAIRLYIDPHAAELEMPERVIVAALQQGGILLLDYSLRFGVELKTDDRGIACTLRFSGVDALTFVPWSAVSRIVEHATGVTLLWPQTPYAHEPSAARARFLNAQNLDAETN